MAPIVLFVYNRPMHTIKTLASLKKNAMAEKSTLFIFADGPKANATTAEIDAINEVRRVIRTEKWCGKVEIRESERNKGLANSIIEGVTEIVNTHGKIIVLEDDLELSPGFLTYMNTALDIYEQDEKVMHIAGFTYPFKNPLPGTFFFPVPTCWGWATWASAWKYFNSSAGDLMPKVLAKGRKEFDFNGSINYVRMLKRNMEGRVNSWFIRWYASIYLLDGLCLHPGKSLVKNTGLDRSGVNSYKSRVFKLDVASHINVERIPLELSREAIGKYTSFNWKIKLRHLPEYVWRIITHKTDT